MEKEGRDKREMNRCQKKIIFFIFVTTTLPVLTLECWNLHPHQENPNSLFCENMSQLLLVTHLPTKDIKNFSLRILMLSTNTWKAVQHQKLLVSSVTQSYATLCDPMNHSTPGVPVDHQLPEFIQTHVHGVDDVIQPRWCHPDVSSSVIPYSSYNQFLPASGSFPMSQLFAWGEQSIAVSASASVLPMHTQDWSPSGWTGWISLQSKELSRAFSNTTVQKHQFSCVQLSLESSSHIHTWLLEKS